jgi:hypothetical protein
MLLTVIGHCGEALDPAYFTGLKLGSKVGSFKVRSIHPWPRRSCSWPLGGVPGASYNPGKFTSPTSTAPQLGNYLLYWMASQALWRVDPQDGKGLDVTFAYDWSPPNVNRNNSMLTAGLCFNEPLPVNFHNTMSLGYVRNNLSSQFLQLGMPALRTENGVEFNSLLDVAPMLLLQPVIQYYANVGGVYNARLFSDSERRWNSKR